MDNKEILKQLERLESLNEKLESTFKAVTLKQEKAIKSNFDVSFKEYQNSILWNVWTHKAEPLIERVIDDGFERYMFDASMTAIEKYRSYFWHKTNYYNHEIKNLREENAKLKAEKGPSYNVNGRKKFYP